MKNRLKSLLLIPGRELAGGEEGHRDGVPLMSTSPRCQVRVGTQRDS